MRTAFAVALRQLPPRERAALVLHDVLDWDLRDIAELLDMRLDAVNCAVLRARAATGSGIGPESSPR